MSKSKQKIEPGFGKRTMLISQEEYERLKGPNADNPNPCVKLYGPGPEGVKCGSCQHLIRYHQSARWNKCDLRKGARGGEGGPATDHRVGWQACARYEPGKESEGLA